MNLLEDVKMSLLNFSFFMIYTIHKVLVLTKNHLDYLKNNIFGCFFKSIVGLVESIITNIRNLFRLKKAKLHCS